MKRLPLVILVMAVLVAMVTGCGRAPRYDGRLVAADSLMRSAPDSALALVEGVCCDSLAAECDRAYRDLLLTQARYRCYITATSDSDINRALAYYRAHQGEREKLTRAYIYKGAVMEELNHPVSAMLYYKHAEATAAPDDYFNLGYANLRIAELYQFLYCNNRKVVLRMKAATKYFYILRDTGYLMTAIGTQGLFKDIVGKDSARIFLEKAVWLGKASQSPNRFFYQSKLACMYFYDKDYCRAKNIALDIIKNGRDYSDEDQYYYYAARSFIKLNLIDSAKWVESMIPSPQNSIDSMNRHLMLADFSKADQDYRGFSEHMQEANLIDQKLSKKSMMSELTNTELYFDAKQRELEFKEDSKSNLTFLSLIFLLLFALFLLFGIIYVRATVRRNNDYLEMAQNDLAELISDADKKIMAMESENNKVKQTLAGKSIELDELKNRNSILEAKETDLSSRVSIIIRQRNSALKELYQSIRVKSGEKKSRTIIPLVSVLKDLNEKKRILRCTPKESFWTNLKLSIDGEYMGLASYVENEFPQLTIDDHHLLWLVCAGLSNQTIGIGMGYSNDVTVSNSKRRVAQKMGLNIKLEDFAEMYVQERINQEY